MKSWQYKIGDVLRIKRKGQETIARVAGYKDALDDTTPLYVNLRVAEGKRWSQSVVKISKSDILGEIPDWYAKQKEQWEAELSASTDAIYAKMTDAQKRLVHVQAVQLGLTQERRSPLDILIDRACGRE